MASSLPDIDANDALYLYGIGRSEVEGFSYEGMEDDRGIRTHPVGAFVAVLEVVPVEAWTGVQGEENLQSLAWVGPRALHHEHVVEAIMEQSPVYPASFGTLFSTPAQLEAVVNDQADVLHTFLDRVASAEEWAVKGMLDREQAEAYLAEHGDEDAPLSPGMAYLKQRQRKQQASAHVGPWLERVATDLMSTFEGIALDVTVLPPRSSIEDPREMVLNWALLTDRRRLEDLQATVRAFNGEHQNTGVELKTTGPWPPYNFRPALTRTAGEPE